MTVFRFLIAIAAQHGLKMRQFDVKKRFLNSTSEDEIFIEQPRVFFSLFNVMYASSINVFNV